MTNGEDLIMTPMGTLNARGLTKREYFAAMAMQGMLVNYVNHGHYGNSTEYPMVSEQAVFAADALIKTLNDKP